MYLEFFKTISQKPIFKKGVDPRETFQTISNSKGRPITLKLDNAILLAIADSCFKRSTVSFCILITTKRERGLLLHCKSCKNAAYQLYKPTACDVKTSLSGDVS